MKVLRSRPIPARMDAALVGREVVFHQAAIVSVPYSGEHPQETHDTNIQGTLNVLAAARKAGVRRVVFASSAAIYGDDPELPKTEAMLPNPIAPYGVEKLTSEYYLRVYSRLYGVETVALRYFNVFGPRQDPKSAYSGVISIFVDKVLAGQVPTIFGDGTACRDFVFVANVVDVNLEAATREGVSGRAFNIACGARTTLNRLLGRSARSTRGRGQGTSSSRSRTSASRVRCSATSRVWGSRRACAHSWSTCRRDADARPREGSCRLQDRRAAELSAAQIRRATRLGLYFRAEASPMVERRDGQDVIERIEQDSLSRRTFVAGAVGLIGVAVGTTDVPAAFVAVMGAGATSAGVALVEVIGAIGLSNCSCRVDGFSMWLARTE